MVSRHQVYDICRWWNRSDAPVPSIYAAPRDIAHLFTCLKYLWHEVHTPQIELFRMTEISYMLLRLETWCNLWWQSEWTTKVLCISLRLVYNRALVVLGLFPANLDLSQIIIQIINHIHWFLWYMTELGHGWVITTVVEVRTWLSIASKSPLNLRHGWLNICCDNSIRYQFPVGLTNPC